MDKTEASIARGMRAEQLLSDPLFVEAKDHIDAELYRLFRAAVPTDTESLTQIKSMQYMHDKYAAFMRAAITDGKMARIELERKKPSILDRIKR